MFLVYTCPYCHSNKVTFNVRGTHHNSTNKMYVFAICKHCYTPTTFLIHEKPFSNSFFSNCLTERENDSLEDHYAIIGIHRSPASVNYQCPKHVPENIEKIFNEAAQCYANDLFIACAAMLRLCLEITTKDLLTDNKDKEQDLSRRIAILCNQGLIRQRLKEFATEIRFEGNHAVHEGCIDGDNLEATFEFTKFLLQELYTDKKEMALVQERRAQRKEQKKTP